MRLLLKFSERDILPVRLYRLANEMYYRYILFVVWATLTLTVRLLPPRSPYEELSAIAYVLVWKKKNKQTTNKWTNEMAYKAQIKYNMRDLNKFPGAEGTPRDAWVADRVSCVHSKFNLCVVAEQSSNRKCHQTPNTCCRFSSSSPGVR